MGVYVTGTLGFVLVYQHIVNLPGAKQTHARARASPPVVTKPLILSVAQGALPSIERGIMLADPSVFTPEIIVDSSLHCKAVFARKFLPVTLPAPVMQLLQACYEMFFVKLCSFLPQL